jgi:hypothetical protein
LCKSKWVVVVLRFVISPDSFSRLSSLESEGAIKFFITMAKFNFSRVWNRVCNFFGACVDWSWWAIKGLAIGLWEVIKFLFLAILVVIGIGLIYLPITLIFCYNPFAFLLWMLICPSTAADGFYEYNRGKEACFGWYGRFIHWMLFWEVKLMPWYVRREFIAQMPKDFSSEDCLRYFDGLYEEGRPAFIAGLFDTPIINDLWNSNDIAVRKEICETKVMNRKAMDLNELVFMLENKMYVTYNEYLKNTTPSAKAFQYLMEHVTDDEKSDASCEGWVEMLIKREGLSSDLISWTYTNGSKKLQTIVDHALLVHGQKATVKKLCGFYCGTDAAEWKAFCEETPNICAEAQMEMNYHLMIKIFYETGHHMEESAIFYWLSVGKFVEYIFANEPEFGLISPRIKALVNNDRELYREYVNAKSSSRK